MPDIFQSEFQNIFYRKTGSGPVLVLIHGFPSDGGIWSGIWDELSANFTLILPDLPGSGGSPLKEKKGLTEMAGSIHSVLTHEGISKAVIAGHSMGGYVASAFSALYPDMVAGISFIHSTPVSDDAEKKKMRQKSIELINNGGKEIFIRQMIPNLFSANFKQLHPEVVQQQIDKSLGMPEESLINFYDAMINRADHTETIKKAGFPVQWILGLEDNIIFYKKILELCYKSEINFVTFKNNCGHMSMLESPGSLVTDLKEFVIYCFE